ncbi:MAG: Dihydrolipoyllysine-residue acetyltransferase [Myxococcaceae bacterium]|nr:Dihydrolipoyllysine-residue acetyltransferase [Myxococcaceae bacterium]
MAKILDMPKLSPTMEEGVLQTWHKKEGDAVNVDDLLAEVETDKATMEFRAFDKGTLLKILVGPGTNVKLGQAVAILGDAGEDVSALVSQAGGSAPEKKENKEQEQERGTDTQREAQSDKDATAEKKPTGDREEGKEKRAEAQTSETLRPAARAAAKAKPVVKGSVLSRTERDVALDAGDGDGGGGRVLASPYVRKVARERGIDLSSAHGSGEHGRIIPADLDTLARGGGGAANGQAGAAPSTSNALARAPGGGAGLALPGLAQPEVRPLSPMRKTIARRLTQSKQTVPHFYLTIDVDADAIVAMRESINAQLAEGTKKSQKPGDEAPKPEKISLNDLVIKAVAGALVRVPECNAQFTEEAILIHKRVDISVAVAIPDGLVTPVVRNADQKSVVAISREVRDLASRARAKKLKPEEMSDGTFSISNLGMFGIDEFAAVINPPEGAILAIGQARDEPVVRDGEVVPGKKMAMTLSCDHRVVDGAVGAAFLAELRALLEHPMRILTG